MITQPNPQGKPRRAGVLLSILGLAWLLSVSWLVGSGSAKWDLTRWSLDVDLSQPMPKLAFRMGAPSDQDAFAPDALEQRVAQVGSPLLVQSPAIPLPTTFRQHEESDRSPTTKPVSRQKPQRRVVQTVVLRKAPQNLDTEPCVVMITTPVPPPVAATPGSEPSTDNADLGPLVFTFAGISATAGCSNIQ